MGGVRWNRSYGAALFAGSLLGAVLNLALPRIDDEQRFPQLVADSTSWGWMHAGLVLAVLLAAAGLRGVLDSVRSDAPGLVSLADGALWVGTGLLIAGLLVAGVALEKAADHFVAMTEPADRAATYFAVLSFDRLAYALFAGASIVLFGIVPLLLGATIRREHAVLGVSGLAAGGLAMAVGWYELVVRDVDTSLPFLAGSLAVTVWLLAVGAAPFAFSVREGRQ